MKWPQALRRVMLADGYNLQNLYNILIIIKLYCPHYKTTTHLTHTLTTNPHLTQDKYCIKWILTSALVCVCVHISELTSVGRPEHGQQRQAVWPSFRTPASWTQFSYWVQPCWTSSVGKVVLPIPVYCPFCSCNIHSFNSYTRHYANNTIFCISVQISTLLHHHQYHF